MGLASEKAAYIRKHGDPVTIIREGGNIVTTARIIAVKRKTDFFSVNYLREGIFTADSGVRSGDLIRNETTSEMFFVMGLQNKSVGGSISSKNVQLYMINYNSVLVERYEEDADEKLNPVTTWLPIGSLPANVEHVRGSQDQKDGLLLPNTEFRIRMQTWTEIMLNDRLWIDGKPYKTDDIDLSIAPGLQVLQVSSDMR